MQLPWIKKVFIASVESISEGSPIAEVEFAELLNPAQETYLSNVCGRYTKQLDIKLAMNTGGRFVTFRRFGNRPIPAPEVIQQLLDGMDIGAVSSSPSTETKKLPTTQSKYTQRRRAVTPTSRTPFGTVAA